MQKIELYDKDWMAHVELRPEFHPGSTWQVRRLSIHDYAQQMLKVSYAYFIENPHKDAQSDACEGEWAFVYPEPVSH